MNSILHTGFDRIIGGTYKFFRFYFITNLKKNHYNEPINLRTFSAGYPVRRRKKKKNILTQITVEHLILALLMYQQSWNNTL